MGKFHIIFTLVSSTILILSGTGHGTISNNVPTSFRVYQHEFQSGPNATVYEVAQAAITPTSPTIFGSVRVGNMIITSGPDINTGRVGRIEGLAAFTGMTEVSATLHSVFVFTDGEYNGSSINLLGRRTTASAGDEVPIAGGTGVFRMARGYTHSSTYSYDPTIYYAVYAHDFYVYVNNDVYVSPN